MFIKNFNGISTFVGYQMPKPEFVPFIQKLEDKKVYIFPKGIYPKISIKVSFKLHSGVLVSTPRRLLHSTMYTILLPLSIKYAPKS